MRRRAAGRLDRKFRIPAAVDRLCWVAALHPLSIKGVTSKRAFITRMSVQPGIYYTIVLASTNLRKFNSPHPLPAPLAPSPPAMVGPLAASLQLPSGLFSTSLSLIHPSTSVWRTVGHVAHSFILFCEHGHARPDVNENSICLVQ